MYALFTQCLGDTVQTGTERLTLLGNSEVTRLPSAHDRNQIIFRGVLGVQIMILNELSLLKPLLSHYVDLSLHSQFYF